MHFWYPGNCLVQSWQENEFCPQSPIQSEAQSVYLSLASEEYQWLHMAKNKPRMKCIFVRCAGVLFIPVSSSSKLWSWKEIVGCFNRSLLNEREEKPGSRRRISSSVDHKLQTAEKQSVAQKPAKTPALDFSRLWKPRGESVSSAVAWCMCRIPPSSPGEGSSLATPLSSSL